MSEFEKPRAGRKVGSITDEGAHSAVEWPLRLSYRSVASKALFERIEKVEWIKPVTRGASPVENAFELVVAAHGFQLRSEKGLVTYDASRKALMYAPVEGVARAVPFAADPPEQLGCGPRAVPTGVTNRRRFGELDLTVAQYLIDLRTHRCELWATTNLRPPRGIGDVLAQIWLPGCDATAVQGVPIELRLFHPGSHDETLDLRLTEIGSAKDVASLFEVALEGAKLEPPSRASNSGGIFPRSQRVRSVDNIPVATPRAEPTPRSESHIQTPPAPPSVMLGLEHERKVGIAVGDGPLAQLQNYLNRIARTVGTLEADYDFQKAELPIYLDLWQRIRGALQGAMAPDEWTALEQLLVGFHLLSGGTPVMSNEQQGGMSVEELTRWRILEQIVAALHPSPNELSWGLDWAAYADIRWYNIQIPNGQPVPVQEDLLLVGTWDLLLDIQHHVEALGLPPLAAETMRPLLLLVMAGFIELWAFDYLLALLNNLPPANTTVLGFGNRGAEYVQAQLRTLFLVDERIPRKEMSRTLGLNGSTFTVGPIRSIDWSPADQTIKNLRHEGDEVKATLVIGALNASINVDLHINDIARFGAWVALLGLGFEPISLAITLAALSRSQGNLSVALSNFEIPILLKLEPWEDGYSIVLANDRSQTLDTTGLTVSSSGFPWPMSTVVSALNGELKAFVADSLNHLFSADGTKSALVDTKGLLTFPWPGLLRMNELSSLQSFQSTHDSWFPGRALWALTPAAVGSSSPIGQLNVGDLPALGYVLTPQAMSAWLLQILPSFAHTIQLTPPASWLASVPQLATFPEPAQSIQDQEKYRQLMLSLGITCGSPPFAVAAPKRFFRFVTTRYEPEIRLDDTGVQNHAGEFVFRVQVSLHGRLRKEYAEPILWPEWSIPPSESESTAVARSAKSDARSGCPCGQTNVERRRPTQSDYCTWTKVTKEYDLANVYTVVLEVRGPLIVGFALGPAANPVQGLDVVQAIAPSLALALLRQPGGSVPLTTQIISEQHHQGISASTVSAIRSTLVGDSEAFVRGLLEQSKLGASMVTGISPLLKAVPEALRVSLGRALFHARFAQKGLAPTEAWDPAIHALSYEVRNGHLVWPIELQLALEEILDA